MDALHRRRVGLPMVAALAASVWILGSCGRGQDASASAAIQIDTLSDTITVRNGTARQWSESRTLEPATSIGVIEGAPEYEFGRVASIATDAEGNVYVLDRQAAEIRSFTPDGDYLRTYGRRGEGPGELASPQAIAVLSDGRVLARDPRNRRVQVFTPTGEAAGEWPVVNPTFSTSQPLWTDAEDRVLVVTQEQTDDVMSARTIVIVVGRDGAVLDTMPVPTAAFDAPMLEAVFESKSVSRRSRGGVPFTAQGAWAVHRDGSIIRAIGDRYRVELIASDGSVRRIERDYEPVPVQSEELAFYRDQVTRRMRRTDPNWRWTGPEIPSTKPPLTGVYAGRDGRIWVRLSTLGQEVENPHFHPAEDGSTRTMWSESIAFDVFESDGKYLGRVEAPEEFTMSPTPVFEAGAVWSVTRDDLGVESVVRFDLRTPTAS